MSPAAQSGSHRAIGCSPELVIVFARSPRLGEVKSRLAATLGAPAALQAYRELLDHALAAAAACPGVDRWLCLTGGDPDGEAAALAARYGLRVVGQSGSDLGQRMARALREGLAEHSRVVLIGCDCPPIDATVLRAALQALASHDLVFGPTEDGGYALIGARAACDAVFASIDWGTPAVMAQTRERLRTEGLVAFELPALWDVDEAADWVRYQAWRAQPGEGRR